MIRLLGRDSTSLPRTDVSLLFKTSFKWLVKQRATFSGTRVRFSWTRLEIFTCTWFSHNTKFCLSACLKPQVVVHVGKAESLQIRALQHTQTSGHWFTNTVWSVKCQVCNKALCAPERNLLSHKSPLNSDHAARFDFDLFGVQKLWRPNPTFSSVLHMAARLLSAPSDFTSVNILKIKI